MGVTVNDIVGGCAKLLCRANSFSGSDVNIEKVVVLAIVQIGKVFEQVLIFIVHPIIGTFSIEEHIIAFLKLVVAVLVDNGDGIFEQVICSFYLVALRQHSSSIPINSDIAAVY